MKSVVKVSAAVALAATVVSAQIDQFPNCAYGCLSQLNAIAGCLATDYKCFCASNAFIEGFAPCIGIACSPPEYQAISDAAEGLCMAADVTVTVTVEAPAPTQNPPRELAAFPGCARDCVSQLNALAGCGETDYKCFCGSNAFLAGFNPCISYLCDPSDYGATSDAAEALCKDNGVTVTVTDATTPPPRTVAPSSTSPPETTEPSETEPAETTGAEETSEPAETSGPEETETSGPEETTVPIPTTVETVTTGPGASTTAPPGNGTTSGSGSTPTTNAGARHTAYAGVLGAALLMGAALL